MEKPILGHIDCPSCGAAKGMRITHDKNSKPFGYCENGCKAQLRIGGNVMREQAFIRRYPWAAGQAVTAPAAPAAAAKPEKIPVTVTEPKDEPAPPPKKRSSFEDALSFLGGK